MRWAVLAGLLAAGGLCGFGALGMAARAPLGGLILLAVSLSLWWCAWRLFETDARAVVFDGARLVDDTGEELCRLDQIDRVDRGLAMWKPTGGFVLTLKTPMAWRWSPGLWWRLGRRVGVGGATPGKSGQAMAYAIEQALADPDRAG